MTTKVVRVHNLNEVYGKSVFFRSLSQKGLNEIHLKHQFLNELLPQGIVAVNSISDADWLLDFEAHSVKSGEQSFSAPLLGTESPKELEIMTDDHRNIEGPHHRDNPLPGQEVIGSTTGSKSSFKKFLEVRIVDLRARGASQYSPVVFEARASVESPHPKIEDISACIIRDLFKEFPGQKTQEYEVTRMGSCQ
ncbi:MAG: hypothetical protein KDD61_15595 [Bdellovibrionales bacterium]|nr:hypothetical protein [Bdellovibrionales bacterium]